MSRNVGDIMAVPGKIIKILGEDRYIIKSPVDGLFSTEHEYIEDDLE